MESFSVANLSSSFSSSLQNIGFYNNPIFWVTCTVQYESAVCEYHREQSVKWSFNTFSTFLWLDKTMNVNVDIKSSDKRNTQKLSANSRKSIKDFILFADRMCHRPPLCWRSRRFYQLVLKLFSSENIWIQPYKFTSKFHWEKRAEKTFLRNMSVSKHSEYFEQKNISIDIR